MIWPGRPAGWPGVGTARSPSDLPGCDQPRHPWALWRDWQRPGRVPRGGTACSSGAEEGGVRAPEDRSSPPWGVLPWALVPVCPHACGQPVRDAERTERGLGQDPPPPPPSPGPGQVGRPSSPPPPAAPQPPRPHRRQQQGSFRGFIDHPGCGERGAGPPAWRGRPAGPSCSSSPAGRGSKCWCSTAPRCRASAGAPPGPGAAGRRHRGLPPAPRPPLRGETVRQTALPCPPCPALERDPEQVPWRPSRASPSPRPAQDGALSQGDGASPTSTPIADTSPRDHRRPGLDSLQKSPPWSCPRWGGERMGPGRWARPGEKGGGEGQAHPQASSWLTPRELVTFRM